MPRCMVDARLTFFSQLGQQGPLWPNLLSGGHLRQVRFAAIAWLEIEPLGGVAACWKKKLLPLLL